MTARRTRCDTFPRTTRYRDPPLYDIIVILTTFVFTARRRFGRWNYTIWLDDIFWRKSATPPSTSTGFCKKSWVPRMCNGIVRTRVFLRRFSLRTRIRLSIGMFTRRTVVGRNSSFPDDWNFARPYVRFVHRFSSQLRGTDCWSRADVDGNIRTGSEKPFRDS